jgi:tetratricopeptide (TPR) repeat protein
LKTKTNELLKKNPPPEDITTRISEVRQYIKERVSKIKPQKRIDKINSRVLTEENKISITDEVFEQENRAKKDSDDDEAYKKMSYSISAAQQKEAKEWFKKAYSTDNLTLKIEYYTKAIELDPKDTYTYFCRGIAYNKLAEYQKAIDDYTKAIEIDPKDAYVYYYRGGAYAHQGLPTVACSDYYQAGILFLKQNNTPQALKCVDFMKKADPSSPLINKLMDQINK